MKIELERHEVSSLNSREFFERWIKERQGVVLWRSQDMSVPRGDTFTPVKDAAGVDSPRPHWAYVRHEVITDITRFRFCKSWSEVGRCKIALDKKLNGYDSPFGFFPTAIVLTDGSTRRVRVLLAKLQVVHGPDVKYRFEDLEAVFEKPEWES